MNGDGVEISGCQLHPHLAHGLQAPGCAASLEQGGLYAPVLSHCISLHPPKAAGDFANGNSSRIGGLEGGAEHLYRTLGGSSSGGASPIFHRGLGSQMNLTLERGTVLARTRNAIVEESREKLGREEHRTLDYYLDE